ncbi:uncharacterized protein F5891DRAFT_976523 [Suillus fuscotomentosus]|uniref:Uncharacterized protein n=1 Tax=Suillus fuscotomentosus TaxID=1912939 RepID=A0AAD4EF68_9AGAM|nr:uncharacterized protein F5891DRAFT_976523 [Suillus fuscotomentosus]KAG1904936.1 hypothetical protein F5891DRAFT_976523 [Suillus fuscotomentosus]
MPQTSSRQLLLQVLQCLPPDLRIPQPIFGEYDTLLSERCLVTQAVFYNIPEVKPRQEVFCVTRGAYIGVVAGWENALNCILGVPGAVHYRVDSIAIGEEKIRNAIDEAHIEMVEPWASPDL